MARVCELTGTGVQAGHIVSHSNRKAKARFLPNLCSMDLMSNVLGQAVRLRITAHALRTVDSKGGLDEFLLSRTDKELTPVSRGLKKKIKDAIAKAATKTSIVNEA